MDHLAFSLDSLASSMPKTHDYPFLRQSALATNPDGTLNEEKLEAMKRKGVFPYEMMTSLQRMEDMTKFPQHEAFYSNLLGTNPVTEEDYQFGRYCFDLFECETMKDYMSLYNMYVCIALGLPHP